MRKLPIQKPSVSAGAKKKLKILLILIVNFILLFALYQIFLRMQVMVGTYLYYIAAAGLVIAYFIINRGFGSPITDASELPEEWDFKKKADYIADVTARHEKAKKLLYVLFPIVIVLMIDIITLFYF